MRGAGHMSAIDKPAATFTAVNNFIHKLPYATTYEDNEIFHFSIPNYSTDNGTMSFSVIIMIVSLILNVFLVLAFITWFIISRRLKSVQNTSTWTYSMVDDSVHSNILDISWLWLNYPSILVESAVYDSNIKNIVLNKVPIWSIVYLHE